MSPPESTSDRERPKMPQRNGASGRKPASNLLPQVYDELRRLAEVRMARLPAGQTLQPTALVHEAYLKLVGTQDPGWNSRGHFFGAAARAILEILVDHARRKARLKRGGDRRHVPLNDEIARMTTFQAPSDDVLRLHTAIHDLENAFPDHAEPILLRYFAGLTNDQIAEILACSTRTIERRLRFGRAWLLKRLSELPLDAPRLVAANGTDDE